MLLQPHPAQLRRNNVGKEWEKSSTKIGLRLCTNYMEAKNNLIVWFGYISCLASRGGEGIFSRFRNRYWYLPSCMPVSTRGPCLYISFSAADSRCQNTKTVALLHCMDIFMLVNLKTTERVSFVPLNILWHLSFSPFLCIYVEKCTESCKQLLIHMLLNAKMLNCLK
jgi:hypothetical protein